MTRRLNSRGFTLTEIIVVLLIVGILASFLLPQYAKTVEVRKGEDAVMRLRAIGTADNAYALYNHLKRTDGTLFNSCNTTTCVVPTANPVDPACYLVACRYLAAQPWDTLAYQFKSGGAGSCGGGNVACAYRRTSGANSTTTAPYLNWAYFLDTQGKVTPINGAPLP